MSENSSIEWTDHTFNPWTGCTKVSPGCANCYAEGWAKRSGIVQWGAGKPRRRTSISNWKLPLKWDRTAALAASAWAKGQEQFGSEALLIERGFIKPSRPRVFCASLADWLDDEVPIEWLSDLMDLIRRTPNLDWLLLTKRPENFFRRLREASPGPSPEYQFWRMQWLNGTPPANVWIGTTVENQEMANQRIPKLLKIPAKVRFLSCEPLLSPVDIGFPGDPRNVQFPSDFETRTAAEKDRWFEGQARATYIARCENGIHWVIGGGESGPNARPMHPDWARSLRDQCAAASVPFLFKQWGENVPCFMVEDEAKLPSQLLEGTIMCRVGKKKAGRLLDGREWNEFPVTGGDE